jgi:hypothetical protein
LITNSNISNLRLWLDNNVHNTYAKEIIPRAVGYSAGLLDYFFRGTIEITLPSDGVYSLTDTPAEGFKQITLLAKNTTTTSEEMSDGSIELVIGYKLAQADPFQSGLVPVDEDFTYIVVPEANDTRSIPKNGSTELTFNLTQGLPLNATNVYLQVIYKGWLGNEDGAVAVGFKDISEPTPIDIFNNMDVICLYNTWYVAGSPEAIERVDKRKYKGNGNGIADEWDVYAHDLQDIYIKLSPVNNQQNASPTVYDYHVPYLFAGSFSRALFILSDYDFKYSFYSTRVKQDSDPWAHSPLTALFSGTAIKRQINYTDDSDLCGGEPPCYLDYYPMFYTLKGVKMWWGGGVIYRNYPYPSNSQCSDNLL